MIGTYRLRKPVFAAQWYDGDYKGHTEIIEFARQHVAPGTIVNWHYTSHGTVYVKVESEDIGHDDFSVDDRDYVILSANGDIAALDEDTFSELFEFIDMVHDPDQLTLI